MPPTLRHPSRDAEWSPAGQCGGDSADSLRVAPPLPLPPIQLRTGEHLYNVYATVTINLPFPGMCFVSYICEVTLT